MNHYQRSDPCTSVQVYGVLDFVRHTIFLLKFTQRNSLLPQASPLSHECGTVVVLRTVTAPIIARTTNTNRTVVPFFFTVSLLDDCSMP